MAVVLEPFAYLMREIIDRGTVYDYAAAHAMRRTFAGRGPAYAVPLGEARVVVRHSRHGGVLAPITRDRFLVPTRAPYELSVALQLAAAGIPTPELVAYATYPAGPALRRVDVVTREIEDATDLGTLLRTLPHDRAAAWAAVTALVAGLTRVGAVHADLNVRNVVVRRGTEGQYEASVLDVDRIVWLGPGDARVGRANLRRLSRSMRKAGVAA